MSFHDDNASLDLTTAQAAEQANVTVATVRAWCRMGAVQARKIGGRWIIWTPSLETLINIKRQMWETSPAHKAAWAAWQAEHDAWKASEAWWTPEPQRPLAPHLRRRPKVGITAGAAPAAPPAARGSAPTRRRRCVTGGNCSSHSGRNCGAPNCDANHG